MRYIPTTFTGLYNPPYTIEIIYIYLYIYIYKCVWVCMWGLWVLYVYVSEYFNAVNIDFNSLR